MSLLSLILFIQYALLWRTVSAWVEPGAYNIFNVDYSQKPPVMRPVGPRYGPPGSPIVILPEGAQAPVWTIRGFRDHQIITLGDQSAVPQDGAVYLAKGSPYEWEIIKEVPAPPGSNSYVIMAEPNQFWGYNGGPDQPGQIPIVLSEVGYPWYLARVFDN